MTVAAALVGIVVLVHAYYLFMEMFLWTSPGIRRSLGMTPSFARDSKSLAANQGLYNGFLAAGLLWGWAHPNDSFGYQIQTFFLVCVLIAAFYGGWTVRKSLFFVQGVPAAVAWIALLAGW
jgi:Predicted membrane protein